MRVELIALVVLVTLVVAYIGFEVWLRALFFS